MGRTDPVGEYLDALTHGDDSVLESAWPGVGRGLRPAGGRGPWRQAAHYVHSGTGELRSYFARCFSSGGIGLEACVVTDDGTRCAVEYNVVRWNGRDVAPQAGIGIYERSPEGLPAAVRVYDDIGRPSSNVA